MVVYLKFFLELIELRLGHLPRERLYVRDTSIASMPDHHGTPLQRRFSNLFLHSERTTTNFISHTSILTLILIISLPVTTSCALTLLKTNYLFLLAVARDA